MPWLALDFDIWRCTNPVAPGVVLRLARRITQASWLASLLEGGALRKVSVTITALLVLITGSVGLEPEGRPRALITRSAKVPRAWARKRGDEVSFLSRHLTHSM